MNNLSSPTIYLNLQPKKLRNEIFKAYSQNKLSKLIKLIEYHNFQLNEDFAEIRFYWNCLHHAVFFKHETILKYLNNFHFNSNQLAYMDIINAKTKERWTPLMLSINFGSEACLSLLWQSAEIKLLDMDKEDNTSYVITQIFNQNKLKKFIMDEFFDESDTGCPINLENFASINEIYNEEEKEEIEAGEINMVHGMDEYQVIDLINGNLRCISCSRSDGNFRYTLCCGKPMHQECYSNDLICICPYCRSCSISLVSDARLALG